MSDPQLALASIRKTHKPHMLCKDLAGDLWEFISYPYIEGNDVLIIARVPGDPCSMITVYALEMDPEGQPCLCGQANGDYYLEAAYYREREGRIDRCPAIWPRGKKRDV